MSLVKSTATIGGYTLISRVLGFLRDVTIASSLGASFLSDAFFVAFKLPNFLRRLLPRAHSTRPSYRNSLAC